MEPHIVALVVARAVGKPVVTIFIRSLPNFKFWGAQFWMFCSRATSSVAWSMVGRSLSGGATNSRSQEQQSSLPSARMADVKALLLRMDAL